jgi:hypothetical protein
MKTMLLTLILITACSSPPAPKLELNTPRVTIVVVPSTPDAPTVTSPCAPPDDLARPL